MPVISSIVPCDLEGHGLALVADGQVELEAKELTHGGAAPLGQPSEHPVATDAGVVADRQLGAIDKVEAGGLATAAMEQDVKGQQQRP